LFLKVKAKDLWRGIWRGRGSDIAEAKEEWCQGVESERGHNAKGWPQLWVRRRKEYVLLGCDNSACCVFILELRRERERERERGKFEVGSLDLCVFGFKAACNSDGQAPTIIELFGRTPALQA